MVVHSLKMVIIWQVLSIVSFKYSLHIYTVQFPDSYLKLDKFYWTASTNYDELLVLSFIFLIIIGNPALGRELVCI